jgi:hypothetical protein
MTSSKRSMLGETADARQRQSIEDMGFKHEYGWLAGISTFVKDPVEKCPA